MIKETVYRIQVYDKNGKEHVIVFTELQLSTLSKIIVGIMTDPNFDSISIGATAAVRLRGEEE